MKTITFLILIFISCNIFSQNRMHNYKLSKQKKIEVNKITSAALKSAGFILMSYANHRQRMVLNNNKIYKINNINIHRTGIIICAASINFDIKILKK